MLATFAGKYLKVKDLMKDTRTIARIGLIVAIVASIALMLWAQTGSQLYLVTGLATPKHPFQVPSSVLAIEEPSLAVKVADLVDPDQGSHFVLADHDRRVIVIGSPHMQPSQLVVLRMDTPEKPRTMRLSYDGAILESFLFSPSRERVNVGLLTAELNSALRFLGFDLLGGGTPQDLIWDEYRSVRTEGFWSPGDLHSYLDLSAQNGKLFFRPNQSSVDLGVELPGSITPAADKRLILAVSNDDMFVVAIYARQIPAGDVSTTDVLVYDKKVASWQTINLGNAGASIRGFGPWIATASSERKRATGRGEAIQSDPRGERQSPGSASRRNALNPRAQARDQVSIETLFEDVPFYFDGELSLYNIRTKKKYRIQTFEGDSEILLVEGNSVYYRVNDTLYRATIGSTNIENPLRMLTHEEVQRAHWAFLGPPLAR